MGQTGHVLASWRGSPCRRGVGAERQRVQGGHRRSPAPFHTAVGPAPPTHLIRVHTGEPRPFQAGGGPAPPTHLLMYSAFSCLPQVLHLKQPRCQCLSKATRDWPFLISAPQPPQPGRKNGAQTSSFRARGVGLGRGARRAATSGRSHVGRDSGWDRGDRPALKEDAITRQPM